MGPEDGLNLRRVLREGVEDGPHRGLAGIGQNGGGEYGLRVAEPVHLPVEVAGTLHQDQLGLGLVQSPAQMKGRCRGQVPYAEEYRSIHHLFNSRQAL